MESETIVDPPPQTDLILRNTSADSELSFGSSHSLHEQEEEGESDSSPDMGTTGLEPMSSESPPPVSVDVTKSKTSCRTSRVARKTNSSKRSSSSPKKSTFGLNFRSMGTKESIDRSTCSTVVGSTHGDTTTSTSRRVRQGSDLSALSHCSEVSETNPTPGTTAQDEDEPNNQIATAQEVVEAGNADDATSPRSSRRRAIHAKVSFESTQPEDCDPSKAYLTLVGMGENTSCDEDDEAHSSDDIEMEDGDDDMDKQVDDCSDCDRSSLEASVSSFRQSSSGADDDINVDVDSGDNSSSSSSDNEIAFDCDSSSEDGSIPIVGSTLHLTDSSLSLGNPMRKNAKKKRRRSDGSNNRCSPAFRASMAGSINAVRLVCGKIINYPHVQHFIVFLILVNALQMGIATFDFVDENPELKANFARADKAFLIVFTVESALQLVFHGVNLFRDGWLTFDFLIVICSWVFGSLQVFRTLRTLRLVGRVEILRKLCEALIEAVPRLTGILFLFVLVMYIYAVMATVLFGDMYKRGLTKEDYFSRLDTTLFTLFQMITLDWAKIVREVMQTYPLAYVVFSTYLTFTSFILFSLIIGVVCDAVSAIEHDSSLLEQLQQKEEAQERILRLQHQVDYLKKQQKSVLASVQTVLDEIVEQERFGGPLRNSNGSLGRPRNLRGSHGSLGRPRSLRSSMASSTSSSGRMSSWRRSDQSMKSARGVDRRLQEGGNGGEYGQTTESVIGQHLSAFG